MGVTARTGVISVIYKMGDKKGHCKLQIHFTFKFKLQNLHFNCGNLHAKTVDVIIGKEKKTL